MGKKSNPKITNFKKTDSFFFYIIKYLKFINPKRNQNNLKPKSKEIDSIKKLIDNYQNILAINDGNNQNKLKIKPNFLAYLQLFEPIENFKTKYAMEVEGIINDLNNSGIKINLKNIQTKYNQKYSKKLSLMTFSRILRHHLNYHFLKTGVKNPKLLNNLYRYMRFFFIKGIARAINLGLKLLFVDETGFKLSNNNYYQWRKKEDLIFGGAQNNLKKKLNMILAINDEKIVNCLLTNESINHKNYIDFLKEMIYKIGKNNIRNYLIIIDNAKYHIDKKVIKFCLDNKLKILSNCPYYSIFNAIEYVFLNIKSYLYKKLIKNIKELKKEINNILNDEKLKKTIKKIYADELGIYYKFIKDNDNENIQEIFSNI
jgi:hypothetical protein